MSATETIGEITSSYDGILAQSLSWNQERINKIIKRSDLRTNIIIRKGEDREETSYEYLGETLALKRAVKHRGVFRKGVGGKQLVEVTPILSGGVAYIYVNDQLVMRDVMEKRQGKMDEKLFAKTFDSSTREGIESVLAKEKLRMSANSALSLGTNLGYFGASVESANLSVNGFLTNLITFPIAEAFNMNPDVRSSDWVYWLFRVIEATWSVYATKYAADVAFGMVKNSQQDRDLDHPYQKGFNDNYNFLKPIKDYLQGYVLLKTTLPLVESKSSVAK